MSRESVRDELARRGLRAQRERGQNFLHDPRIADAIADAAPVAPGDAVIEIGPGLGVLTRALAARARRVVAIEIDAGLVRALREEGALPEHVELLHRDALDVDLAALARSLGAPVRVVANLPYAVSSPLLRRLLDARGALAGWLVLVQREVAQRLVARPGSRDYGSLAVLHALTVASERVRDLPPACFFPVPQVVSTLVRMTPLDPAPLLADELASVERVVRAAFGTRRKTLPNALRTGLRPAPALEEIHGVLDELGIARNARAEVLEPAALLAIARRLAPG
ncbi:MAG: ribosomal RNA small subunit methyltransferase A [Proteobacteria bacterium]|nr:MAG: ribosomal RNA small subunit methyltransferase A [Pseudomonadota bacterium]